MPDHGVSCLFVILLWWLSTGLIVLLCALPRRTFPWSLGGWSLILAAAFPCLAESARSTGDVGSYLSFLSAIAIWGWLEMGFLTGYVTGPRKVPCPADATGWRRFLLAVAALLYHELSIVAVGALVLVLTWGAPNQTGSLTFLILMVMRISAKLNLFLGVPNLPEALLPARLAYLKTYFRCRKFNPLFPVSILGSCLAALPLAEKALASDAPLAVGSALTFTLLALAVLEHLLLMLPVPDLMLWKWAKPFGRTDPVEKSPS